MEFHDNHYSDTPLVKYIRIFPHIDEAWEGWGYPHFTDMETEALGRLVRTGEARVLSLGPSGAVTHEGDFC